jgi:hypothetical protein
MHGRSCARLLALSFLILAANFLSAQSDRAQTARDSAFPISLPPTVPPSPEPKPPEPRPPEPFPPEPRPPRLPVHWPLNPGTFGFPQITRAAGTIFSGTVTVVSRRPLTGGQLLSASSPPFLETVAITFHVDQAIRGATPGEDFTISQWMGMWSSGQRYRVGEHVLLFLYPLSKLGLTSCVGGGLGRFVLDPMGRVLLTAQHLSAFRSDPVLGGKSRVPVSDFATAVRRVSEEESAR